jgi:hypothetical protein
MPSTSERTKYSPLRMRLILTWWLVWVINGPPLLLTAWVPIPNLVLALFAVLTVPLILWRGFALSIKYDEEQVCITNVFHTRKLRWAEATSIEVRTPFYAPYRCLVFVLKNGERVPATISMQPGKKLALSFLTGLKHATARSDVSINVRPPDPKAIRFSRRSADWRPIQVD